MVGVSLLVAVALVGYALLWLADNPESNPYAVNRLYRWAIAALLAILAVGGSLSLKAVEWHRGLRQLILERCQ